MHEDPTRRMDVPPPGEGGGGYGEPPQRDGMSTGVKAAIGILVAAVLGLGAALLVVASEDGDDEPATTPATVEPTTTAPADTTATTTPTETTDPTTTPTTTAETTTTTDTTVTDPATTTEGSGGTEAP